MKLLIGGNPQIAKADVDAPVQAYIAAMPGWKRDIGKGLDVRNVPNVRKDVRSPTSSRVLHPPVAKVAILKRFVIEPFIESYPIQKDKVLV